MGPENRITVAKRNAAKLKKKRVLGKKVRDVDKEVGVVSAHPLAVAVVKAAVQSAEAKALGNSDKKAVVAWLRAVPAEAPLWFGVHALAQLQRIQKDQKESDEEKDVSRVTLVLASTTPQSFVLSHLESLCHTHNVPLIVANDLAPALHTLLNRVKGGGGDGGADTETPPFCVACGVGVDMQIVKLLEKKE